MSQPGTPADELVTRGDLERALRHVNFLLASLRDELLSLGAQVVTLTNELVKKEVIDDAAVTDALPEVLESVRIIDEDADPRRVDLGPMLGDKHELEGLPIPCTELLHLCEARCCRLTFVLNTQDLDEGMIRWDYARPYWILQRPEDGYCIHNDAGTRRCTAYKDRPAPCREFDCRNDPRIWVDFERRIPAPESAMEASGDEMSAIATELSEEERKELRATVRQRQTALYFEEQSLERSYGPQTDGAGRDADPKGSR